MARVFGIAYVSMFLLIRLIDLSSRVTKFSSVIAAMVQWFWDYTWAVPRAVIPDVVVARLIL